MPSRYLDENELSGHREFRFDFERETLAGKAILLAGATGGLGSATAALLAREGARLVLGFRSNRERAETLAAFLEKLGAAAVSLVAGDLSDPAGREAYLAACPEDLYGLVSFVGDPARFSAGPGRTAELQEALEASWSENFLGPALLARLAAERMRAAGTPGAIVLFSTMQAVGVFENSVAYAAPKAALLQAARILAREFGGKPNIRVNVIAPGATTAGMAESSIRSGKYDGYIEQGVIPRFGRPEDVARAVRFFLQPDNYVTGQVLVVDGGLTLRR